MFAYFVCVVWCQVDISATSWSLVQVVSFRLWCVVVCDQETSCDEENIARAGLQSQRKKSTRLSLLSQSRIKQLKINVLRFNNAHICGYNTHCMISHFLEIQW
jgi:hypothetical protein